MANRYYSNFTGEIYDNIPHVIKSVVRDWVHFPTCRTLKSLDIRPSDGHWTKRLAEKIEDWKLNRQIKQEIKEIKKIEREIEKIRRAR